MAVSRPHLFEFIDLAWYPDELRNLQTEALAKFMGESLAETAPLIREVMDASGTTKVVDLCSGGGGPWETLYGELANTGAVDLTLTDAFPNPERFRTISGTHDGKILHWDLPVRAEAVPPELDGVRTMFSAFHHLRPDDALEVLRSASETNTGVAIFDVESARAGAKSLVQAFVFFTLVAPVMNLLFYWFMAPKLGPLSWQRVLFTYLIPVVPFVTAWDGLVSGLRAYTRAELTEMASMLEQDGYVWTVGAVDAGRFPIQYITGRPASASS